ncbi:MAG: uracil-DNA glycosylase family protein [Gaiellaceae bacterium]
MSESVDCADLACGGVERGAHRLPELDLDPARIRIVMIAEAVPVDPHDWFYADGDPLFARTTLQAFREAGENVWSLGDLLDLGVYVTTAVKCGKSGAGVPTDAVRACSQLLESELALFPNARVLMLMGDVAIKALNAIARRNGEPRVIPAGSTYMLRDGRYWYRGMRAFPCYLQAGPAFYIEKSKRRMIAEDIAAAIAYAGEAGTPAG